MKGTAVLVVAALGVLGAGAGPASAKTTLTLKTAAGTLASGQPIVMSSSDIVWHTPSFKIECLDAQLEGALAGNSAAKDDLSFSSAAFVGEEIEGACRSSNMGVAPFTTTGLPWKLALSDKGAAKMTATGKLGWSITLIGRPGDPKCSFEAKSVEGTVATDGVASITWSQALFEAIKKGNAAICPREADLSATWLLSSAGEAVEAEL